MKVEQAIYGEVRGGHALRMASDLGRLSTELTSRLDLPDTAPPGVDWSPFLSGFPHRDYYVFSRTFSDPTATRAGMVLSHAVFAPLEELSTIADLRPVLALLIATPEEPVTLDSGEVLRSAIQPPEAVDLLVTAEALTTRGTGPVVRSGCQGFEDLVVSLWFHLWPEFRQRFAFRLSFGPQDIFEVPKPSLVCTPRALTARWSGHRIIGHTASKNVSRAAEILSGGERAEPVLRFAHELGVRLNDLGDLPLLERAYELGTALTPTFAECVAVLRMLERLSPNPTAGTAGKVRLVQRLTSHLPTATVSDILLLRNLSAETLPVADTLWTALRAWARNNLFSQVDDESLLSAVDDATATAAAIPAWCEALLGGICEASRSASSPFPGAFWRWAEVRPTTLIVLADHLVTDHDVEALLVEAQPADVRQAAGDAVMEIALRKRWYRLHGAAAGATLTLHEAVSRQFSVDTDPESIDGVRVALRRATPQQVLAIALETADARLMHIAAEKVAQEPQLLKEADFRDAATQDVWAGALSINSNAWQGPAEPQQAVYAVLDTLIGGRAVDNLLAILSLLPVADLGSYSRRIEVWPRVSGSVRYNLLKATAHGWLKHATSAGVPYAPERELEAVVLEGDTLDRVLRGLIQTDVGGAVRIISALPGYAELRFLRWLAELAGSRRPLTTADAESLGRLVLERRWEQAVDELLRHVRTGRDDLKPALRICYTMVGFFSRWSLGLSPVSYEEKLLFLEELAAELYPNGPDTNELWDRAGGRQSDLQNYGTGRTRWHNALQQVRRGREPRVAQLLEKMSDDYPLNEQLRYLVADSDLGVVAAKRRS